jgi:uncharacterized protein YkwD
MHALDGLRRAAGPSVRSHTRRLRSAAATADNQGMPTRLVIALACTLAALLGAVPASASAATTAELLAPTTACPGQTDTSLSVDAQEAAMRCMVDFARTVSGVPALAAEPKLMDAADRKARDILACQQFSHTACGLPFTQRITDAGYAYRAAAENIAYGTGSSGSVRSIMTGWLNSAGHKANLLSATYRDHGIALAVGTLNGNAGARVWVEQFATPR